MKTSLLLILLGTLLSCQTTSQDRKFIGEQCSPSFAIATDEEGKEWIDVSKSQCNCREYQVSIDKVGANGKAYLMPFNHCNLVKGYKPKTDTTYVNFLQAVRKDIKASQEPSL